MGIPSNQLSTWSNQGATVTAKTTHEAIRKVLNSDASLIKGKDFEIFLQGSYKNNTNIRGDSDVDVVVQLNSTFGRDISPLPQHQQELYRQSFEDATYLWSDFKADVLKTLKNYYGSSNVKEGNKSIKVLPASGRLPADVIPCIQYRKYTQFLSVSQQTYVEGMKFYTTEDNREVVNYPKLHYQNGSEKNQSANENYKPSVRMFKNARTFMRDKSIISVDLAPSYFVEGLLFNVPNNKFSSDIQDTYVNVINWLLKADYAAFVCQNKQLHLFGSTPEQWDINKAKELVNAYAKLWNGW